MSHTKRLTGFKACCLAAACCCLLAASFGTAATAEPAAIDGFGTGVQAYRDGRYTEAEKQFSNLHAQRPEDSRLTYYLAITQAQLGRFAPARALYEEILKLDPNSEAAALAREGLSYLPTDPDALDLPPRFQSQAGQGTPPMPGQAAATPQVSATPSMQDMMMWQMMSQMGGNNNNNNGGFNPMPYMMMPQANGENPMGQIDPNVMSNMMMNQMMQNFSLDGNKDNDR